LVTNQPLTLSETVTYTLDLSTASQHDTVLLDRVVAMPTVFLNASSLIGRDENERFQATCDVIANDMK